MQRVFVLSQDKQQLMPCSPARARELLRRKRARVFRLNPFTIILQDRNSGDVQNVNLNIDPGSRTTGFAVVVDCKRGRKVFFGANLAHRGLEIKQALEKRRAIRHSRRNRKTRYRKPRFKNRTRAKGWLPPSLLSRVSNVLSFSKKLQQLTPINNIAVETVRFDMQKLVNPEITGVKYQQGTLHGYEVREYLLEKWDRQCVYCEAREIPLEIEHIVPRSKGGSDRVSNLALACNTCNQKKSNTDIKDFLKKKPQLLAKILAQTKKPLKDAAAVNATRYRIGEELKTLGLPTSFYSGGRTKYNRTKQNYPKDHWIDAACVGYNGARVYIPKTLKHLDIKACGHGTRQMCRVNQFGFPRTSSKQKKVIQGFKTGDFVKVIITAGKKVGTYKGRVAVRATGNFNVKTKSSIVQGINARYCRLVQKADGYNYTEGSASSFR